MGLKANVNVNSNTNAAAKPTGLPSRPDAIEIPDIVVPSPDKVVAPVAEPTHTGAPVEPSAPQSNPTEPRPAVNAQQQSRPSDLLKSLQDLTPSAQSEPQAPIAPKLIEQQPEMDQGKQTASRVMDSLAGFASSSSAAPSVPSMSTPPQNQQAEVSQIETPDVEPAMDLMAEPEIGPTPDPEVLKLFSPVQVDIKKTQQEEDAKFEKEIANDPRNQPPLADMKAFVKMPRAVTVAQKLLKDVRKARNPKSTRYSDVSFNSLTGFIIGNNELKFDELGAPMDKMIALAQQPTGTFAKLLEPYSAGLNLQDNTQAAQAIQKLFSAYDNRLPVAFKKGPTVRMQKRFAKITPVNLIEINQFSAKVVDADFDSDQAQVIFFDSANENAKVHDAKRNEDIDSGHLLTASQSIIGVQGDVKIDSDFILSDCWHIDPAIMTRILSNIVDAPKPQLDKIVSCIIGIQAGDEKALGNLIKVLSIYSNGDAEVTTDTLFDLLGTLNNELIKYQTYLSFKNVDYEAISAWDDVEPRPNDPEFDANVVQSSSVMGEMPGSIDSLRNIMGYSYPSRPMENQKSNLPFRSLSGISKLTAIFTDQTGRYTDEYTHSTADVLLSLSMAKTEDDISTGLKSSTILTEEVLSGMNKQFGSIFPPTDSPQFFLWVKSFVKTFNDISDRLTVASMARDQMSNKWEPRKVYDHISDSSDDFGRAFRAIYGNYLMSAVFGPECPDGWTKRNVNDFCRNNTVAYVNLSSTKRITSPRSIIEAIADRRSSYQRLFNDSYREAVRHLFKTRDVSYQTAEQFGLVVEAINLLTPDMARHYHLDSVGAWINSEIGQRLLSSKNPDDFITAHLAYYLRYRLNQAMTDMAKVTDVTLPYDVRLEAYAAAQEKYQELEDSSPSWEVLIALLEEPGDTIMRELMDPDVSLDQKLGLKSDVLRAMKQNIYKGYQPYQVMADIFTKSSGSWFDTDLGHQTMKDNIRNSQNATNKYLSKNLENLTKEANDVIEQDQQTGRIKIAMEAVAAHPEILVDVDYDLIAAATLAGLTATSSSSKKAEAEPAVAGIFQLASYIKNGTMMSDLRMTTDLSGRKVSLQELSGWNQALLRVISDPDFGFTVYDGIKEIRLDDLGDVKQLISDYPQFAELFCRRTMYPSSTPGTIFSTFRTKTFGSSIRWASSPEYAGEQLKNTVVAEMITHPSFFALLSLMRDRANNAETLHPMTKIDIDTLVDNIMWAASHDDYNPLSKTGFVPNDEHDFSGESATWEAVQSKAQSDLDRLVNKTRELIMGKESLLKKPPSTKISFSDSDVSRGQYTSTYQMFGGAKASIAASINGKETRENAFIAFSNALQEDDCQVNETFQVPLASIIEDYEGYKTSQGTPVRFENLNQIEAEADEAGNIDLLKIESCASNFATCKKHTPAQLTLPDLPMQGTPVTVDMANKRADGTEKFALKVRKAVDDGTDSIHKYDVWSTMKNGVDLNSMAHGVTTGEITVEEAVMAYAQALYDADHSIIQKLDGETVGYETSMADCIAKARSLTYVSADGQCAIWTTAQYAQICRDAVNSYRSVNGTLEGVESYAPIIRKYIEDAMSKENGRSLSFEDVANNIRLSSALTDRPALWDQTTTNIAYNYTHAPMIMVPKVNVEKFAGRHSFLSNMFSAPVKVNGITYRNVEAAFQSFKTTDIESRKDFANLTGPAARAKGKKLTLRSDWNDIRLEVMRSVVLAKFKQNPGLLEKLSEIDGQITEGNTWGDNFWGVSNGSGANNMGKILMGIRDDNAPKLKTSTNKSQIKLGTYPRNPGETVFTMRDTKGWFGLNDSERQWLGSFAQGLSIKDSGVYEITLKALLEGNMNALSKNVTFSFPQQFTKRELDLVFADPSILKKHMTDDEIDAYKNDFDSGNTNERGVVTERDILRGDIVGIVHMVGDGIDDWLPIRSFDIRDESSSHEPRTLRVDNVSFNRKTGSLEMDWHYNVPVLGNSIKAYEVPFTANKSMARPGGGETVTAITGDEINSAINYASTSGRAGDYEVVQLMNTVMEAAQTWSKLKYKITDDQTALSSDPELRQLIQSGTSTIEDWRSRLDQGEIMFYQDNSRLNEFCNWITQQCVDKISINPSLFFCSSPVAFNYAAVLRGTPEYTQQFRALMSRMIPGIVPAPGEATSDAHLFDENFYMQIKRADGSAYRIPVHADRLPLTKQNTQAHGGGIITRGQTSSAFSQGTLLGERLNKAETEQLIKWANTVNDTQSYENHLTIDEDSNAQNQEPSE